MVPERSYKISKLFTFSTFDFLNSFCQKRWKFSGLGYFVPLITFLGCIYFPRLYLYLISGLVQTQREDIFHKTSQKLTLNDRFKMI